MQTMTGIAKLIPRTMSPYPSPELAQLANPHHDIVAELLIRLLEPLGTHRRSLRQAPKKSNKKRKRKTTSSAHQTSTSTTSSAPATPSPPKIQPNILIGFNAITRHLETLSTFPSSHAPSKLPPKHITAVFLLRPLDDLIYAHLPLLCHTASLAHQDRPGTRLVLLHPKVEGRIVEALALGRSGRVSVLALLEAEGEEDGGEMAGLCEYVRDHLGAMEVDWLKEVKEGKWLGTKVEVR